MSKNTWRWIASLAALLVGGPASAALMAGLRASDGSGHATALTGASAVGGLIALAAAFLAAAPIAGLASRYIGVRTGMFCAGLTLAWAAWATTTIDDLVRRAQSVGVLRTLALEGVVVALGCVGLGVFIHAVSKTTDPLDRPGAARASGSVPAAGLAMALACAAAWIIARDSLKGQCVAAAAVGAVAGGAVMRTVMPRASALAGLAGVSALAALGPLAGWMLVSGGGGGLAEVFTGRGVGTPLARVLPMDWAAGVFLGLPMGLNWARSFSRMQVHETDGRGGVGTARAGRA